MGDLNAHHLWWQGPLPQTTRTSPASHTIATWLEENNFYLQNEPGIPTHHPRNGESPSTIDLYLSHGATTKSILSLAVNHDITSYHSTLTVTLSLPSAAAPPATPRRCWHKANWQIFNIWIQSVNMDLSQLQGPEDTLHTITNVTELIHQAVDVAVPFKGLQKSAVPWWNHSLTVVKQSVKRADRRARLQPTDTNLKDSQHKRHKWSTMVRNAKTAYRIQQLEATSIRIVLKTFNTTIHTTNPYHLWMDGLTPLAKAMCYEMHSSQPPTPSHDHHFQQTSSPHEKTYANKRDQLLRQKFSEPLYI